ncbi:uncharacterized protein LODBEIA_P53710 [Lodderomyces beijingensis]|uniref:Lumazine-binding domain-containing protein n=1 Tax=Lodderomyces beijingensis TaxID=1775926 RepID=A0ABP0ZW80_9ASCO
MFTGLIEKIGTVAECSRHGETGEVTMKITDCTEILADVHLGDSICTNGVCLTVTDFDAAKTFFRVGVAPETLRKSNLGSLAVGSKANLERAVTSEVRLGGHVVQGHVDTIATIVERNPDGNALAYTFELRDKEFIRYVVHKGFVAVDGTSLTVTNVDDAQGRFSVMLISYSQSKVVMTDKHVGDTVNVEVDLTGKLIEKQVELNLRGQIEKGDSALNQLISALVEKKVRETLK